MIYHFNKVKDLLLLTILTIFSFFVITFNFGSNEILYHDNAQFFGIFRDNLHSLNYFGEIALWYPQIQYGWPSYYYSILGDVSILNPIFGLLGIICFLIGKVGITINNYYPLYLLYFGFLIPLFHNLSVYFILKQLFKSRSTIIFGCILAAFSPGIILNVSDIGLVEGSIYSTAFVASAIYFSKNHSLYSFLILSFFTLLLCLTINFSFLMWNIVAIPLFLILVFFLNKERTLFILKSILRLPKYYFIYLGGSIIICLMPTFLTLISDNDLIRSSINSSDYSLSQLQWGNPIEILLTSLPGYGMEWRNGVWTPIFPNFSFHTSYFYLGIISLPLTIFGLLYSKDYIKYYIYFSLLIILGIIILSSASPIFSMGLTLFSFLRANNHFSDLLLRSGGYIIIILSTCLGYDYFISSDKKFIKNSFLKIFIISSSFLFLLSLLPHTLSIYMILKDGILFQDKTVIYLSLFILITISYLIIIIWFRDLIDKKETQFIKIAFLLISFIDLSTISYINVNKMVGIASERDGGYVNQKWANDNIGLDNYKLQHNGYILSKKTYLQLNKERIYLDNFPNIKLFTNAHYHDSICDNENSLLKAEYSNYSSILLPSYLSSNEILNKIGNIETSNTPTYSISKLTKTYNSLNFLVNSETSGILFIKDSYSPYWSATVNSNNVEVFRSLLNFKAVAVPSGLSKISFNFNPPLIVNFIYFSYLVIIINFILIIKFYKIKNIKLLNNNHSKLTQI